MFVGAPARGVSRMIRIGKSGLTRIRSGDAVASSQKAIDAHNEDDAKSHGNKNGQNNGHSSGISHFSLAFMKIKD